MEAADLCGLGDRTLIERLDARDRGMLPAALNELRTAGDTPDTR